MWQSGWKDDLTWPCWGEGSPLSVSSVFLKLFRFPREPFGGMSLGPSILGANNRERWRCQPWKLHLILWFLSVFSNLSYSPPGTKLLALLLERIHLPFLWRGRRTETRRQEVWQMFKCFLNLRAMTAVEGPTSLPVRSPWRHCFLSLLGWCNISLDALLFARLNFEFLHLPPTFQNRLLLFALLTLPAHPCWNSAPQRLTTLNKCFCVFEATVLGRCISYVGSPSQHAQTGWLHQRKWFPSQFWRLEV